MKSGVAGTGRPAFFSLLPTSSLLFDRIEPPRRASAPRLAVVVHLNFFAVRRLQFEPVPLEIGVATVVLG